MQPPIKAPLLTDRHIILPIHPPLLLRLDPQPPNPPYIPLHIPRQPPGPQIRRPGDDHSRSADGEGHFVPVMRVLFEKELGADDAADLSDAGLKGEGEGCAGCAFEGGAAPSPERNEVHAVCHRAYVLSAWVAPVGSSDETYRSRRLRRWRLCW